MNFKKSFGSEDGAESILEAAIVFPLVFMTVIFLLFLGLTYIQKSFLNYQASQLSAYIAKVVCFPGYQYLDEPFYKTDHAISLDDIKKAMKSHQPYRYLFGLTDKEVEINDSSGNDLIQTAASKMAKEFLSGKGMLKSTGGTPAVPDDMTKGVVVTEGSYACAISATTSKVTVYLAQNYTFAGFFRMIGVGNKNMSMTAKSTSFITDSLEILKLTDTAFDLVDFTLQRLGISTEALENIKEKIQKFTKN